MNNLTREIRNIQNPALGASLIWRFACGYGDVHRNENHTPLPLVFLVLPILFHSKTRELVSRTQKSSGLRKFAAKFGSREFEKQDLLLSIHNRAITYRVLSLESIELGVLSKLISLDHSTLVPLSKSQAKSGIPKEVSKLMADAEKLGFWCSQQTLHEVSRILNVRF